MKNKNRSAAPLFVALAAIVLMTPVLAKDRDFAPPVPAASQVQDRNSKNTAVALRSNATKESAAVYDLPPAHAEDEGRQTYESPINKLKHIERSAAQKREQLSVAQALEPPCTAEEFSTIPDSQIAAAIKSTSFACINKLFSDTPNNLQNVLFDENTMAVVADGLAEVSSVYAGNNDENIIQLIHYLRAGYFVQFYNSERVPAYGAKLKLSVTNALDSFVENSNFNNVSQSHGQILQYIIFLIDGAVENVRYIKTLSAMLSRFTPEIAAVDEMPQANNAIFTVFFRAVVNNVDGFAQLLESDPSIVDNLIRFTEKSWLSGTRAEYLWVNSVLETGRLLKLGGATKVRVKSALREIIAKYDIVGEGARVYMKAASMVNAYDESACATYGSGVCNLVERVTRTILNVEHRCNATLKIRAQDLNTSELAYICTTLPPREDYFHELLATGRVPVADDNNASLEVVVFGSKDNYDTYAGTIFNINTNNGGIYLEGSPELVGNQSRFIAYVATWLDTFDVWNLRHEYVHYLDGRFDLYGGFRASGDSRVVWWTEGLAEYSSKRDDNNAAINLGLSKSVELSSIFYNTYADGQDRVYRWGYLAMRFMFERHRDDIDTMLSYLRIGDYVGYQRFVDSIKYLYDNEFHAWIDTLFTPQIVFEESGLNATLPRVTQHAVRIPRNSKKAVFEITEGEGDTQLFIKLGSRPKTDGSDADFSNVDLGTKKRIVVDAPSSNDYYYFVVRPRDTFRDVSVRVSNGELDGGNSGIVDACAQGLPYSRRINAGVAMCLPNTSGGRQVQMAFYVDADNAGKTFTVDADHGEGNGDVYYRYGSRPKPNIYDERSINDGNSESVVIADAKKGWHYVHVRAATEFSNMSVLVDFAN